MRHMSLAAKSIHFPSDEDRKATDRQQAQSERPFALHLVHVLVLTVVMSTSDSRLSDGRSTMRKNISIGIRNEKSLIKLQAPRCRISSIVSVHIALTATDKSFMVLGDWAMLS